LKTPLINISIEGETIQDVLTFRYEDSITLDNMLEFVIHGREELIDKINAKDFASGKTIVFSFGYAEGQMSVNHTAILVDTDVTYEKGGFIKLKVRGLDIGTVLKKSESIKDWSGNTTEQIVKTIAEKYAMDYEIEDTSKVHENLHQHGRSDFEFIAYLAYIEGGYIFYVRGETMYLVQRGLDKKSRINYMYGLDDTVLSFSTSHRDIANSSESSEISVTTVEDDKVTTEDGITREKISDKDINLGNFELEYLSGKFDSNINRNIVLPTFETIEVTNITESLMKETKLMVLTGIITVEGDPWMIPDEVMTLGGNVLERDKGNWYVEKVSHSISNGYITTMHIAKNATDEPNAKKSINVNTSNKKVKKEDIKISEKPIAKDYITIRVYDADGKLIGYETDQGKYIDAKDQTQVKRYTKKPVKTSTSNVKKQINTGPNVYDTSNNLIK